MDFKRSTKKQNRVAVAVLPIALVVACGSKKEEDLRAIEREKSAAAEGRENSNNTSVAVLKLPGEDANAQSELGDPCTVTLTQQSPLFKGDKVIATFKGKLREGCATADKQLVLYIKTGENQIQLPATLDCQPKGKQDWNVRCLNTKALVNEKGEALLSLEADANYRGSLTAMQLVFEGN